MLIFKTPVRRAEIYITGSSIIAFEGGGSDGQMTVYLSGGQVIKVEGTPSQVRDAIAADLKDPEQDFPIATGKS